MSSSLIFGWRNNRSKRSARRRRINATKSSSFVRTARQFLPSLLIILLLFSSSCGAFVSRRYHRRQIIIIPRNKNWRRRSGIESSTPILKPVLGKKFKTFLTNTPINDPDHKNGTSLSGADNKKNARLIGLLLAAGVVANLAMSSSSDIKGVDPSTNSGGVAAMTKVFETAVPSTSTDLLTVALGESIAGVIGAAFSVVINFLIFPVKGQREGQEAIEKKNKSEEADSSSNDDVTNTRSGVFYQGISDGDYFIANAASYSLLESVGVPADVAKLSSVFIAAIPSQLVKIGASLTKQKREKEEQAMLELLRKEKQQKFKQRSTSFFSFRFPTLKQNTFDRRELKPVAVSSDIYINPTTRGNTTETEMEIDLVEVFADITRWLEYDVLKTEFGETAVSQLLNFNHRVAEVNPMEAFVAYAFLGALAATSSRFYSDLLYGQFCYGPLGKQKEVRNRTGAQWLSLYSSTAASGSVLFGCYEIFQRPIGRYVQAVLSGGFEGCVGSSSFNSCINTYIATNSPEPTGKAQLRALLTNLYAVWVRLQDIAVDTSADDVSALVRAWSVSVSSYMSNHF